MKIFSRTVRTKGLRLSNSIATAALALGLVGCGESGSSDSDDGPSQGDFMGVEGLNRDPAAAGDQLAAEALEASDVTQVVTALSAPLAGNTSGIALRAAVEQAIDKTVAHFGTNCVSVVRQPGLDLFSSTVIFEFADCTGPFKALSFSGTSTTDFHLDLQQRSISVTTADDLVIHKNGGDIPVVSSRSGTLSDRGLELDLEYTGIQGEPRHVTGLLEVAIGNLGCVVASLTGTEEVKGSGFEVSNLEICADGNICVGGAELKVLGFRVSLDFQSGSFTFSRPNAAPVDIALPTSAPVCVDAF